MRPSLIILIGIVFMGAGCNSPACGDGLLDTNGRCVVPKCNEPCNAGAHEVCDATVERQICVCAPGYEGDPCQWAGVLRDPGFMAENEWSESAGASVEFFDPVDPDSGQLDEGVAFLRPSVVCNAGVVSQVVEMPSRDVAEPFVAVVNYKAENVQGISIGFNRAWKSLPATQGDNFELRRFCLGEAAYAEEVQVQVGSFEKTVDCTPPLQPVGVIEIDRLSIEVAGPEDECPAPGEFINPEAEAGGGGWEFDPTGQAEAGFAENAGKGGSNGARLFSSSGSQSNPAAMTTQVSVPLPSSLPSPALKFWWSGSSEQFFQTELGTYVSLGSRDRSLGTLVGIGSEQVAVYCMPPWTYGNVVDLSFKMIGPGPDQETELVVDAMELISEESCGDWTDILDPGFESTQTLRPGISLAGPPEQFARIGDAPGVARTGDGVLEISYETTGAAVIMETWVFVPPSDEETGPEMRFWSNVPAQPELSAKWVVGRVEQVDSALPKGVGWQENVACLPKLWANRWYRFQIWVGNDEVSIPAPPTSSPKTILIDDLELTTSRLCK